MALQMTFKAINNFIKLDSLIFTFLVYRIYPYITENDPLLLSVA